MMNSIPNKRIVLFDGICNLCNGFVQFILRHEKNNQIVFASLQSEEGKALLDQTNIDREKTDSVVFIDGNRVYLKSKAALNIAQLLRFPWNLLAVFKILPPVLTDWLYDLVARYRYRLFGKRDACYVPTPGLKNRFLDG